MKKILYLGIIQIILVQNIIAQMFTTNTTPVGLEHNILFNATSRYTVTQTGAAQVDLNMIFDGIFAPSYTSVGVNSSSPTVIEISGLPGYHIQRGAWVGWSTRWWEARKFKIEAYDVYYGNGWVTVADYSNTDYTGGQSFTKKMPNGSFTKLRFTIYSAAGIDGRLGISELFFVHPEVTKPYGYLFKTYSNLYESGGKIGIGKSDPQNTLDVNGTIHAKKVQVDLVGWSDFVFDADYKLRSLTEVEEFVKANGHLPEIPNASEVEQNGVDVGEMQAKLLQKVEELTLYMIELKKENELLKQEILEIKKK